MLAKSCMPLSERRYVSAFTVRVRENRFTEGRLASRVGRLEVGTEVGIPKLRAHLRSLWTQTEM